MLLPSKEADEIKHKDFCVEEFNETSSRLKPRSAQRVAFSPRLLNANQHNSITDKIEGADKEYIGTYGLTTKADKISLQFVTEGPFTPMLVLVFT